MQTELTFTTKSPINIDKLSGQNRRLYDWLSSGKTIHCMHNAMSELKIGYLNSRISDLKKYGVEIYKRFISVDDTTVKEYSLKPFEG